MFRLLMFGVKACGMCMTGLFFVPTMRNIYRHLLHSCIVSQHSLLAVRLMLSIMCLLSYYTSFLVNFNPAIKTLPNTIHNG